jgi:hypothetical protein
MVLRSVGVMSAGKVSGAMGVFAGMLIGGGMLLFAIASVAVQALAQANGPGVPMIFLAVVTLTIAPAVDGVFGFVMGIIYAFVYNLLADYVGGLELNFENRITGPIPRG